MDVSVTDEGLRGRHHVDQGIKDNGNLVHNIFKKTSILSIHVGQDACTDV